MMQTQNKTARRLTRGVFTIILLCISLAFTTFSLAYSMVSVENNLFSTGVVKINLNDGAPLIRENELLFEPGMTVRKDFFVENESSCDVYYRLYFQNVTGGLAEVLEVKICDGDKVLFQGTPAELNRQNVGAADDLLGLREKRNLQIYFHFPEGAGLEAGSLYLSFDFAADAVQADNNANMEFD